MTPSDRTTTRPSRRDELLGMAAKLFATRGYPHTTVRDIADEAGILSGSLYHHFDSKEAMLQEILEQFLGGLLDGFETVVASSASPRETLDSLVRLSFATIHAQPWAVALYQNEASLTERLPGFDFVLEKSRRVEALWLEVLQSGAAAGEFRADLDPDLVYRFVRDTVWSSVRWYNPEGRLQHEAVAEQYLTMLHGGLLS